MTDLYDEESPNHPAFDEPGGDTEPQIEHEPPDDDPETDMDWADEEPGWMLNNLAFHLGQDPFEILEELRVVGRKRADAESTLEKLKDQTSAIKAHAAERARSAEKTEAQIREERDQAKEVTEHMARIAKARKKYKRLETEYWALKQEVEMIQSSMYLLGSELKTLRGA